MKILSCGAGQQSTALALMSCENAIMGSKRHPLVPIYDAIIFCDLGGERAWVYEQVSFIKAACKRAGIPFYILQDKEISKFINTYKSASSRLIKKEYPSIRKQLWKEMFWSKSFCLLTTGGATIDVIKKYIEQQGEK